MKFEMIKMHDGYEIQMPVAENILDCFTLIQSDLFRLKGETKSISQIIWMMLRHPLSYPMAYMRLSQISNYGVGYFARRLYKFTSFLRNIDIPYTTKIGFGFYIGHGMCIVINGGTIIGNNCNVSHFINIGSNNETPAIIGDNVYLAPMTALVEDVQIGTGAVIGAGAVVTRDVPKQCIAVGVPAKVISSNAFPRRNCWNCNQEM